MPTSDETWTLADHDVPVYCSGEGGRVLILIHEVWGVDGHIRSVADRYAAEGFRVVAPELLADSGLLEQLETEQRADYDHPVRRLPRQVELRTFFAPVFTPQHAVRTIAILRALVERLLREEGTTSVSVTGFCYGGTFSWALALAEPRVAAAVPFYGHNTASAEELGSLRVPVLAFYGDQDAPLMAQVPGIREATAGKDVEIVVYPGAGHAFFNDANEGMYRADAATDAWPRALAFLREHAG
ncbi:dienelactone hydrolase family protein [Rathayibacter festucae]|jgi:carboxymethylenebutenolidase|uniref:dienelactone hydrolase family protein n=1 Tax=Rathayibacter festucae TaxID=110937 RepID=UPI001FB33A73|nr:dienelactone hydrolase family protein [Rathayibacter festucae]MCJ1701268.1 dienelactone hydrolase family protein [Rathayibacter festucae]